MGLASIAPKDRLAAWAVIVTGLVFAAPILVARYPPMGDLAMHEALIAIMRHVRDPSWAPERLYYVVAPQANQLFPLAAFLLSYALPTDVACKVLVAAIVLSIPPLTGRLLARLGLSRWLALLAGPIACGWMFRWGLVANLTGFALLLFALPELERLARRASTRAIVRSTACATALFLAHESSAIVFALIAGLFAIVRSSATLPPHERWRRLLGRLAPALFTAALCALQWRLSDRLRGANMREIGTDFGADPLDRVLILPGAIFGPLSWVRVALVGGLWVAALAASAALGWRASVRRPLQIALWQDRYAVLAMIFAALYLVFPMSLGGTTLLAHRFLPPACACFIVACARRRQRILPAVLAGASALAMVVAEAPAFVASNAQYRALDRIIALVPEGVAVAQLDLTAKPAGHVAPIPGAAGRVLAERGGRMLFAMTDMPPNPVYVRDDLRWEEPVLRMGPSPYAFMPAYDFTRFAYLLERNDNPRMRALVALAIAPEAELVVDEGEWSLFRSRLQVADLATPDQPLPSPPPETLAARVNRLRATRTPR